MTRRLKRAQKENEILDAAEIVFAEKGFSNAKMEEIGEKGNVSKATVYFYFESKENLYMAIAFRAMNLLNDMMYDEVHVKKQSNGLDSVINLMNTYFNFAQKYPLYTEAMLDYMILVRSSYSGKNQEKLTDALKESIYFKKAQDIHNIPVSLVTQEIKRGVMDGSIKNRTKPEMLYLTAWGIVLGYLKLTNLASKNKSLHTVNIDEWKKYLVKLIENLLTFPEQ